MFYPDYWADRIEAAPTPERRAVVMRLRDAALHRSVIERFAADYGHVPHDLRRKQHLQRRRKGKRACGQMRGEL